MSDRPDIPRLIGDLIRFGRIASVDLAHATCRVELGELQSGDIPFLARRAGATRSWSPPTVGEQCVVLASEGDLEAAVVLLGLFSNANPAPSGLENLELVTFADGTTIGYDSSTHELNVALAAGGTLRVQADAGVTITGPTSVVGDVAIDGDLSVSGEINTTKVTASDDVIAAGKSLKGHKHTGVQTGGGISGLPQ